MTQHKNITIAPGLLAGVGGDYRPKDYQSSVMIAPLFGLKPENIDGIRIYYGANDEYVGLGCWGSVGYMLDLLHEKMHFIKGVVITDAYLLVPPLKHKHEIWLRAEWQITEKQGDYNAAAPRLTQAINDEVTKQKAKQ